MPMCLLDCDDSHTYVYLQMFGCYGEGNTHMAVCCVCHLLVWVSFVCLYQQVIVQSLRGWGTISIMSYSNKCPALCEWLCSNVRNCQLRAVSGMPVCGLVSAILFFVYCHHPSQCDYLSKIKFKRLTTFPDAGIWQQNDGAELGHCPWSKHTAQGIKG